MGLVLPAFLQPHGVNERFSRLLVHNDTLQKFFGVQAGGPNIRTSPFGRRGAFDIFNDTRQVPPATLPGSTAVTIAPNPVGNVAFTIPRLAINMPVVLEMLANTRPIGGPVNEIDETGQQYIVDHERYRKQLVTAFREFQVASMIRGKYTFSVNPDGSNTVAFSGQPITVNYQIPSGNLSQLNMLGGGSIIDVAWSSTSAKISTHLTQIDAALVQLTGRGLRHVWINGNMWQNMISNTQLQAQAGSVNQVWDMMVRADDGSEDFECRLKAVPWVKIHVTNQGLAFAPNNGSFSKLIDDDSAFFTTEVGPEVVQLWQCGEPVVEEWNSRVSYQVGEYHYYEPKGNPAVYQGFSLLNVLPILKVPACFCYGTVVF